MGHRSQYSPRQEEILTALEGIFLEEGFRDLAVGDLVRRVHCSRQTLYEIAPTKEELFLVVVDRLWRRLSAEAREALLEAPTPADQIRAFMVQAVTIFKPPWTQFMEDVEAYGPARRLFHDHLAIVSAFLADLVEDGVSTGQFAPTRARIVAEVLIVSALKVTSPDFLHDSGISAREAVETLAELTLCGLLRRVGTDTRKR